MSNPPSSSGSSSSVLPYDESDVVTMLEVQQDQQQTQRQAQLIARRGGDLVTRCRYQDGYISQPLYACRTCSPLGDVALCLGCSMNCHCDHQVEELHEKRGYRCDCGNSKDKVRCELCPDKDATNPDNHYNHNFMSRYCHCDGNYNPDQDVMYQCLVCQDWFHGERCCPGLEAGPDDDTQAMVCRTCLAKPNLSWLRDYLAPHKPVIESAVSATATATATATTNDVLATDAALEQSAIATTTTTTTTTIEPESTSSRKRKLSESAEDPHNTAAAVIPSALESPTASSSSSSTTTSPSPSSSHPPPDPSICRRPTADPFVPIVDAFTVPHFRDSLCRCTTCMEMYRMNGCMWVVEEADREDEADVLNVSIDETEELDPAYDVQQLGAHLVERLPRAETMSSILLVQQFNACIREELLSHAQAHPGEIITELVMRDIAERAKQSVKRARLDMSAVAAE